MISKCIKDLRYKLDELVKNTLFEFNDKPLRDKFKKDVSEWLDFYKQDDIIDNYLVVCDESNNTEEMIFKNSFLAEIFMKFKDQEEIFRWEYRITKTDIEFSQIMTEGVYDRAIY